MASAASQTLGRVDGEASKPGSLPVGSLGKIVERASLVLERVTEQRQTTRALCVWCGEHSDYKMGSGSDARDLEVARLQGG